MPSASKQRFKKKLLPDVHRLIEAHNELNPEGRGRRYLGHITRSGVVMLCAAWELYIEDVCKESVEFLSRNSQTPNFLPNRVKGMISKHVKNGKNHEFAVLELCHDGWKKVYKNACQNAVERLHAPKFGTVSALFYDWLGVNDIELESSWRNEKERLNEFVTLRGEIAHRGADAQYVNRDSLKTYAALIETFVIDTDNFLADHLKVVDDGNRKPWNKTPIHH